VVPAYTLAPGAEHIRVLRVLCREDFSVQSADMCALPQPCTSFVLSAHDHLSAGKPTLCLSPSTSFALVHLLSICRLTSLLAICVLSACDVLAAMSAGVTQEAAQQAHRSVEPACATQQVVNDLKMALDWLGAYIVRASRYQIDHSHEQANFCWGAGMSTT